MKINPGFVLFLYNISSFQSCPLFDNLFCFPLRAQAKRKKTSESDAAPTVQEPEKTKPASPVPHAECTEAREEAPADNPHPYEPADNDTVAPTSPPQPVFQAPNSPVAKDVTLTGADYQSPSHVLTRHSSEAKENSPERFDFAFPSLEKMSTDDLHAGYLNRLSASHNMERKLVGLMKSKFEVLLLSCFPYTLM